jgi:hypothetical protein
MLRGNQDVASTAESQVANLAGMVHSMARESFAAANSIFTDAADDGLSNAQHGAQVRPLESGTITHSLLGARLAQQFSSEQVVCLRLVRNLTAPVLEVDTSAVKSAGLGYGVIRFRAEWGAERVVALRAVPAAVLALSGRVPGGSFSRGRAARRIGPYFGIRTVGSFDDTA